MLWGPESSRPVHTSYLPDKSKRDNTKFLVSTKRDMLSQEVTVLKIFLVIDVNLEDLVLGVTERNEPIDNDILGAGGKRDLEKLKHFPLIFIRIHE